MNIYIIYKYIYIYIYIYIYLYIFIYIYIYICILDRWKEGGVAGGGIEIKRMKTIETRLCMPLASLTTYTWQ